MLEETSLSQAPKLSDLRDAKHRAAEVRVTTLAMGQLEGTRFFLSHVEADEAFYDAQLIWRMYCTSMRDACERELRHGE